MMIKIENDETLEDLQYKGLKIIQSKNLYRLTSDSVVLSNFVKGKSSDILLDLGTGCGIIAILASQKNKISKTFGIEIQPQLAKIARKSVEYNNLQDKIKILNIDMKSLLDKKVREDLKLNLVDIVVCNPPYKKSGTAKQSKNESEKIARHEIAITLEEIVKIAKSVLKFHGKFYIVCDADRVAELIFYLKGSQLEPKRMFFTQSGEDKRANLVFIEAILGAKESVQVLPMLITNDKDGKYLEKVKKIRI